MITDKVVKALDKWIAKVFADTRLTVSSTYKRMTAKGYDNVVGHGKRTEESTSMTVVKTEERNKMINVGGAWQSIRIYTYVAQTSELPAGFDLKVSLDDRLTIDGEDLTVISGELILDRLYSMEVSR